MTSRWWARRVLTAWQAFRQHSFALPPNGALQCTGNGECNNGFCKCDEGWCVWGARHVRAGARC